MKNLNQIAFKSRRGLKELDIILEKFNDKYLKQLSETQISMYLELLENEDALLFELLSGRRHSKSKQESKIVEIIIAGY